MKKQMSKEASKPKNKDKVLLILNYIKYKYNVNLIIEEGVLQIDDNRKEYEILMELYNYGIIPTPKGKL